MHVAKWGTGWTDGRIDPRSTQGGLPLPFAHIIVGFVSSVGFPRTENLKAFQFRGMQSEGEITRPMLSLSRPPSGLASLRPNLNTAQWFLAPVAATERAAKTARLLLACKH